MGSQSVFSDVGVGFQGARKVFFTSSVLLSFVLFLEKVCTLPVFFSRIKK